MKLSDIEGNKSMKKINKFASIFISLLMLITVLTACDSNKKKPEKTNSSAKVTDSSMIVESSVKDSSSEDSSSTADSKTDNSTSSTIVTDKQVNPVTTKAPEKTVPGITTTPGKKTPVIIDGDPSIWEVNSKDSSKISHYAGPPVDILHVPNRVNGINITTIDCYCFSSLASKLKDIVFPEGITQINGLSCFSCWNLRNVTIPSTVNYLDGGLIASYSPYVKLIVKNPNINMINDVIYNNDKSIILMYSSSKPDKSFTIPSTVRTIKSMAFCSPWNLEELIIPNSVTKIEPRGLDYCKNIKKLTIPDSVTSIGSYAFADCRGMEQITLSKNITSIESYTFDGCSSLKSIVIPDKVKTIGWYAFSYCNNLTEVTIPKSVISISEILFNPDSKIAKIKVYHNSYAENWCKINGYSSKIVYLD